MPLALIQDIDVMIIEVLDQCAISTAVKNELYG